MGNTPSDSSSSSGDMWDIWARDDEEEARLLARAAAGGKDTTGLSVTGADGVTGAVTGTGADATGVTGVTGGTTTGAPVAKIAETGNVGLADATGGSGVCVAGTTVGGHTGKGDNKKPTGAELPTAADPLKDAAAAAQPQFSAAMLEAMAMDPPYADDLCGLEPDPNDEWEECPPDPRIKESRLSSAERAKYMGLLDQIFHPDTILGVRVDFDPNDVAEVCDNVIPYLESEPMLIEDVPFDITIVADVHGQLYDLNIVFKAEERDGKKGWENMKFLFLGDYVDRGRQSLEIVMALYCIKMLYPDRIFLLRGNHEYVPINMKGGFAVEFFDRYSEQDWPKVYSKVNESFCYLSCAAIVGNSYFCAHGGISMQAFTRRHLLAIRKPILEDKKDLLLHDIEWADPALGLHGSTYNGMRLCSVYFGLDELAFALYNMDCTTLFRGHSIMNRGFEIIGGMCISLFTATGTRNFNDGAVAIIDAEGKLSFRIIKCSPERVAFVNKLRRRDGAVADVEDDCLTVEDDSGDGETINLKKKK